MRKNFFHLSITPLSIQEIRGRQISMSHNAAAPVPQPLPSVAAIYQSWPSHQQYNVAAKTYAPAKCDLHVVIHFLHAEGCSVAKLHRRMSKV